MREKLYRMLARIVDARLRCMHGCDKEKEWFHNHTERLKTIVREHMPHGAGFDNGTTLDLDESRPNKLIFHTSFHHMDENGSYDGWSEHAVTIIPSLCFGFEVKVFGRDRNDIKNYIGEIFHGALSTDVE